jgi:heptosyltransferase III
VTKQSGKILVIRGGAIGDFILTLPVLAALRRQFPGTRIEVLGYPHIVQLALAEGLADAVRSIEAGALAGFFARNGELAGELTDYFSDFDLIVSYLYDPDKIFQTNVARCSPAQFLVGPHRPAETDTVHATAVYLKPLKRLAIFDADPVPHLTLNPQPSTFNQLALHPGSGSEEKNWPEEKWAELIGRLMEETDYHLLLVGGEAEGGRMQRLSASLPALRFEVAQSLPLTELAWRLGGCAGFVGHDSGISHLAAALGLPSLILWGDTAEALWRPQGGNVRILRHPKGLKTLPVEQVVRELAAFWSNQAGFRASAAE